MLDELPTVIGSEKNNELQRMPNKEEVHEVLMGNSASGPDRMTGVSIRFCFLKRWWGIHF